MLFEGDVNANGASNYGFGVVTTGHVTIPPLTGTALVLGTERTGAINDPNIADDYTFTITAATKLYFDGLTEQPGLSWSLIGPRGIEISSQGFTSGEDQIFTLTAPGTYQLHVVSDGSTTGSYSFRLSDVSPALPVTFRKARSTAFSSGQCNPALSP